MNHMRRAICVVSYLFAASPVAAVESKAVWNPAAHPTMAAAAKQCGVNLQDGKEGTPTLSADFDGDGREDAYFASRCAILRHHEKGWDCEQIGMLSQPENSQCGPPLRLGTQILFSATSAGHETDAGMSYSWEEAGLYTMPQKARAEEVWSGRVELNRHDGGQWTFASIGSDAVLISVNLGDDAPAGYKGPMWTVIRREAGKPRFAEVTCWQKSKPTQAPTGAPACTARPGAGFHLRISPVSTRKNAKDSLPAGTVLDVLARSAIKRGAAQLYCVRTSKQAIGYAFLLPAELQGCPPSLPTLQ